MPYIFSDPHFGHETLRRKARAQFKTIEEHDNYIVSQWNSTITNNNQKVYLLGDIGSLESIQRIIPQLRGDITLIRGNHDNYSRKVYEELFNEVLDFPLFVHRRIVLSHIPIPTEPGVINVHGHTHDISLVSDRHFNVSAERIDYKPVRLKYFINKLSDLEKPNYKFLNEWYKDIQRVGTERSDLIYDKNGIIDARKSLLLLKRERSNGKN